MLNTLLIDELNEIPDDTSERFKVENIDQANWCFRKIRALQEKVAENKRLADEERERINIWEQKENESAENSIEYFKAVLSSYFTELKEQDPKAKVSTPYGKITSRKNTKWDYINEADLMKYLEDNNPSLIRIKKEINKADLKKTYKNGIDAETGEILPGVKVSTEENISINIG